MCNIYSRQSSGLELEAPTLTTCLHVYSMEECSMLWKQLLPQH
eukprot:jgi/Botrbrau1/16901/Bobra.55_3s0002.1